MITGTIYCLKDPDTNSIRYIGQTRETAIRRFYKHKYQWTRSKNKLSHVNAWIKKLAKTNKLPILDIIEDNIPLNELNNKEIYYIKTYKELGTKLTNLTEGGSIIPKINQSDESKLKRLNTLKTSKNWINSRKRQAIAIKEIHKNNPTKIGFRSLSKEKLQELRVRAMKVWKKKVMCIEDSLVFESIKEAGLYYNIEPTHITRICKGKSKSGKTHNYSFKYVC